MGKVAVILACAIALTQLAPRPIAAAVAPPSDDRASAVQPCGTPGTPTTTVFLPNITKTLGGPSGWVTPFIVQNVGVRVATLELSFYRFSDGALVACRKITEVLPATSFADVPNNDLDLPGDSQFSVVVKSFGSEVVSVVNEHAGSGARAEALSYNGLTTGASSVFLPFVAKPDAGPCTAVPATVANCNARWLTTFIMQNFGAQTATVTARFASSDGGSTATLTRTIAPGRSRFIDPSVEPLVRAGRYYSVVLTATQPIGVVVNAHDDAPDAPAPRGFSYNGVAQPAAGGDLYLPYIRRDAGTRSYPNGVLVQNAGTFDAVPSLSFRRLGGGTGNPLVVAAPVLRPGATWYFDPEGSQLPVGEHSLVISGGTFAALSATVTPTSAMAAIASTAQGNRSYLPNITRTLGGASGWTTPIVLQSSGATTATLRWYRFSDGALVARQPVGPLSRGAAVRIDPRSVPALTNDTQYGVVIDSRDGNIAAVVTELDFHGGDGTMGYEGFPATVSPIPAPTAIAVRPGVVRLGTQETMQLTATVKDQFDEAMPQQAPTFTVAPFALGAVSSAGLFTAGTSAGAGSITATAGAASETIALFVQAPVPVTLGGISFLLRTTGSADVYAESTITGAEAATVNVQVNADIARIQQDYGRVYAARPHVYVLATDSTYSAAQTNILGVAPAFVTSDSEPPRGETAGVYFRQKVAVHWGRVKFDKPLTITRHELTHMMIDEITGEEFIPSWLNEGSAILEEYTVPGSLWMQARDRHRAVSMAVTGQLIPLSDLQSQLDWNRRTGLAFTYQYAEAQELVQLLRTEAGTTGVLAIFALLGAGFTFEEAYAAVTGRSAAAFAESAAVRLRSLAMSPGIAFAPDSIAGAGMEGPTFVVYGFAPSSFVTLTITGAATGVTNNGRAQQVDAYGVYWSRLGPAWPADTYTFTVTNGPTTVTRSFAKTP